MPYRFSILLVKIAENVTDDIIFSQSPVCSKSDIFAAENFLN